MKSPVTTPYTFKLGKFTFRLIDAPASDLAIVGDNLKYEISTDGLTFLPCYKSIFDKAFEEAHYKEDKNER